MTERSTKTTGRQEDESKQQGASKTLVANWQTLQRIFLKPESESSRQALTKYMDQILFGLNDFLREHVGITEEIPLKDLASRYTDSRISRRPEKKLADVIRQLVEEIAPQAVNVSSPYFVGHMTSAIPFFMVHLATIVAALNQNTVKLETSKVVSVYERQVLAKVHRMIFGFDEEYYRIHIQKPESTLGSFVEDGTLANLTALWVARNRLLGPKPGFDGIEREGGAAAYRAYDIDRCVILVSELAHYSIRKACGVLGLGNENIIPIAVDRNNRMDTGVLEERLAHYKKQDRTAVCAVLGIAGTTETGAIDPLPAIAELCSAYGVHFHVDAAWGGPTLLSEKYRQLLAGIEKADSVTIDGHKQFYLPMSCGMVYFKNPVMMDAVAYYAAYINRPGSVDLGIRSLVGSKAATSLVLGSALEIMGAGGYQLLIDHGIEIARAFARKIEQRPMFELVTSPELNILTYRVVPEELAWATSAPESHDREAALERINNINKTLQRLQREAGNSFVSRTTLHRTGRPETVVLRTVLMNPMTDMRILEEILDEQESIYKNQIARMDPDALD